MKQSLRAKRLVRQQQRLSKSGKLNLVALMDIFTILVFFLMVNQSDVQVLQSNKSMTLPQSVTEDLPAEQLVLTIASQGILLQGVLIWQGDVRQDPADWQQELKDALRPALQRHAERARPLTEAQQQSGRPLTILGDATTPYAALRRIMAICATTDYRDLSLAVEHAPSRLESLP